MRMPEACKFVCKGKLFFKWFNGFLKLVVVVVNQKEIYYCQKILHCVTLLNSGGISVVVKGEVGIVAYLKH